MLSLLVQARHEDGSPMSDAELRDELMTLLVAGHETTATSLAWAIERLVRHPDKLDRLREEARRRRRGLRRTPSSKETLRLRPVLPIVVRRLTAADGDRRLDLLPAGVARRALHPPHAPAARTSTPTRTRSGPERFLEQPAGTYTWIPFGGGVRRCLGASFALFEMKIVLRAIVREAALRPPSPAGRAGRPARDHADARPRRRGRDRRRAPPAPPSHRRSRRRPDAAPPDTQGTAGRTPARA